MKYCSLRFQAFPEFLKWIPKTSVLHTDAKLAAPFSGAHLIRQSSDSLLIRILCFPRNCSDSKARTTNHGRTAAVSNWRHGARQLHLGGIQAGLPSQLAD